MPLEYCKEVGIGITHEQAQRLACPTSLDSSTTRTNDLASSPLSLAIQQNSNVGKAWLPTKNLIKTSG
jgi:hypothetical protein